MEINPLNEAKDLSKRVINLLNGIAISAISFLQLITQIIFLFCTVFITTFTVGRKVAEKMTKRMEFKDSDELRENLNLL
jgi:hypothetical protein